MISKSWRELGPISTYKGDHSCIQEEKNKHFGMVFLKLGLADCRILRIEVHMSSSRQIWEIVLEDQFTSIMLPIELHGYPYKITRCCTTRANFDSPPSPCFEWLPSLSLPEQKSNLERKAIFLKCFIILLLFTRNPMLFDT